VNTVLICWNPLQVLNGLLSRDDAEAARAIPLGIIPAGSDNSLIWTVFGIRDATSAAVAIVKVQILSIELKFISS
jgi:diacylglycerol kinase family enzyme